MQFILTCGLAVLCITQVAQGTFVVTQVIEGDAGSVHGLEVVSLVAQHLQTVLLHSLIVYQLWLQQTRCRDEEREQVNSWKEKAESSKLKKVKNNLFYRFCPYRHRQSHLVKFKRQARSTSVKQRRVYSADISLLPFNRATVKSSLHITSSGWQRADYK